MPLQALLGRAEPYAAALTRAFGHGAIKAADPCLNRVCASLNKLHPTALEDGFAVANV